MDRNCAWSDEEVKWSDKNLLTWHLCVSASVCCDSYLKLIDTKEIFPLIDNFANFQLF